ncbi:MAG: response regulator [Desulfomonile tiedjei]|uniref:Response regulator n=1 Tax=Desulfomonile tiedjei TaxID=2358 RepID=A0A9D6Z3C6_9BACT|nr:response regulator [Desulfomonile tiedjei]
MVRVFVLEDDPLWGEVVASDLERSGLEVTVWQCLKGAVDQIRTGNYDLLVLDIIVPFDKCSEGHEVRDGGIQVLESLAAYDGKLPPTLFVTIWQLEDFNARIVALRSSGSDSIRIGFLSKPYAQTELINAVGQLLQHPKIQT